MKILYAPCAFLIVILLAGCAAERAKPSPVSIQVGQIRQALDSITESYEKKDEKTFFEKIDPSFKNVEDFKGRAIQDFATFSQIKLELKVDRIRIEDDSIWVAARWSGAWKTAPEAPPLEKRGNALLRWTAGEDPKLLEIRGDPPFGVYGTGS